MPVLNSLLNTPQTWMKVQSKEIQEEDVLLGQQRRGGNI